MRRLTVIILALFLPGGGIFSQSNISLLDEELIKENRINEVTEWNHAYIGREPSEKGRISLRASYDKMVICRRRSPSIQGAKSQER